MPAPDRELARNLDHRHGRALLSDARQDLDIAPQDRPRVAFFPSGGTEQPDLSHKTICRW